MHFSGEEGTEPSNTANLWLDAVQFVQGTPLVSICSLFSPQPRKEERLVYISQVRTQGCRELVVSPRSHG